MTLFLASVRDRREAEVALGSGADIIDLKDPARGALGAVNLAEVAATVRLVAGKAPVSATVGDLPMQAPLLREAVRRVADCGVDYVKLGIFPGGDPHRSLEALASEAGNALLILVAFADRPSDFDATTAAASSGARGVMLDTAGKLSGSLPDVLDDEALTLFIAGAKRHGLLAGLAGSLRARHVPRLLQLRPDVLGFRGALCKGEQREAPIDPEACRSLRKLIRGVDIPAGEARRITRAGVVLSESAQA